MIMTATTGRNAKIILPDNSYSAPIELSRGNSQGDCPSPLLFNLCNQILIFKLELDPTIIGPFNIIENPRMVTPRGDFQHESNRETDKVDSFADDTTGTFLPTRENLITLKSS